MARRSLLDRVIRAESYIALAQWLWDRITGNIVLLTSMLGSGGLMAYLATITEWAIFLGPLGIGAIAIATAIFVAVGVSTVSVLRARAEVRRQEVILLERSQRRVHLINPLETEFNSHRIRALDLAHPVTKEIVGKRLHSCELIGPANLLFLRNMVIVGVAFGDCDIVVVRPSGAHIDNVIGMRDCMIYGGSIWRCTIFITPDLVQEFRGMGANFVSFTGVAEIDRREPEDTAREKRR